MSCTSTAPGEAGAGGEGDATVAHQPGSLSSKTAADVVKDVCLWRRKALSTVVLVGCTVAWIVIDVLGYRFLQVASWVGISACTTLFLRANLGPFFGKNNIDLSNLQLSEDAVVGTAQSIRAQLEDDARRGIRVLVVDRDPLALAQMIGVLGTLAWIGSWCNLLTLVYIGVLLSLTCPVIYRKHEDRIMGVAHCARRQGDRLRRAFDEKVANRLRGRQPAKAKKTE